MTGASPAGGPFLITSRTLQRNSNNRHAPPQFEEHQQFNRAWTAGQARSQLLPAHWPLPSDKGKNRNFGFTDLPARAHRPHGGRTSRFIKVNQYRCH
jgi:hypothetical protein